MRIQVGSVRSKGATSRPFFQRVRAFIRRPLSDKTVALAMYWRRFFVDAPVLLRLPFGGWWIARSSALDRTLLGGAFESAETRFVAKFLQPGMTVLDVGAHHGFYTLLASMRVGPHGCVIAFEPSPRERRRLSGHLRLNLRSNVRVERFALGDSKSPAQLFVVNGPEDWCNSLRPPALNVSTQTVKVSLISIDDYLSQSAVTRVDFIKLDVEGAERDVLRGATGLLKTRPRPVILAEVSDVRTAPWGYRAKEIIHILRDLNYEWFRLNADASLERVTKELEQYDTNLVAIPEEGVVEIVRRMEEEERSHADIFYNSETI